MRWRILVVGAVCGALFLGVAEAEEPKGVRLRWFDVIDESPTGEDSAVVEWGVEGEEVEKQLGRDCYISDWSGVDFCLLATVKYGGWWADFGDGEEAPRSYLTTLHFLDGQFFRYFVEIPPERFALVESALVRALGEPDLTNSGAVQNRMGASFDQEERGWKTENVDVYLSKRAANVTEGLLVVSYRPLAEKMPKEEIEAPFGP